MALAQTAPLNQPLSELNTTPLIDVLLVLLVLLVITIPPATHSLEIPLPPPGRTPAPKIDLVRNTLSIDLSGTMRWNGQAQDEAGLFALLQASTKLAPEPELRFEPDGGAPYEKSLRALNLVKASGVSAFGFAGVERFSDFEKPPR